jgi:hypothetical protein
VKSKDYLKDKARKKPKRVNFKNRIYYFDYMNHRNKRLIVAGIGGFIGGGMGAVAGSASVWINMLVGGVGGTIVVLLINGFIEK